MKRLQTVLLCLLAGLLLAACKRESLTGPEEINLAGCPVPAGITYEAAEAIQCDKESHADTVAVPVPGPETLAVAAASVVAAPDAEIITAAIAERARRDGGSEFAEARRSAEGDLDGDGMPDLAVLYTLEGAGGGNTAYGYLAAFVRGTGQLTLVDTVVLPGSAEGIALKDGSVHFKLLSLGPDDSDCCPSVEEDAAYVLHGGKLLQVQAQP
ncbi:hypothetical protein AAGG49_18830 [Stenotrophomonas maltophilia]|uniref:hypothetical protein n=1 Tax=Stenotrophomonas maltophilia TaxID=40324 RepID=UPI00313B19BB